MTHATPPTEAAVATLAPLTNVRLASTAIQDTMSRAGGLPGLVCLYGRSGYGKSSAAAYISNKHRAYYIELKSLWSKKHILTNVLRDMGVMPAGTVSEQLDQVCETLAVTGRPLIIDQADYLVDRGWAPLLMDIFEGSGAPLLFIGEEKLSANMRGKHNTVHRRVLHWIEAQPASMDDCAQLARLYAPGVDIAEDLLSHVNALVDGCTGRVAVNLHRIGATAAVQGWDRVDRAVWGDRDLYTGEPRRG